VLKLKLKLELELIGVSNSAKRDRATRLSLHRPL